MAGVTPKSLLLDLLRVSPRAVPVRDLVAVGDLFGFEDNAIRVALTRLVRRGLVESDERGSYRLGPESGALPRLVDAWRQGDRRLRAWRGRWLCVWHPRGASRAERRRSHAALGRLGFREGRPGLWVRPRNLRMAQAELRELLTELGLLEGATLFVGDRFEEELVAEWTRSLWKLPALRRSHERTLANLERSRHRLLEIPLEDALVESFLVGGECIRVLATDPLLPDEILDGSTRRALHEAMLEYDEAGKRIWGQMLTARSLEGAPSHLSAAG